MFAAGAILQYSWWWLTTVFSLVLLALSLNFILRYAFIKIDNFNTVDLLRGKHESENNEGRISALRKVEDKNSKYISKLSKNVNKFFSEKSSSCYLERHIFLWYNFFVLILRPYVGRSYFTFSILRVDHTHFLKNYGNFGHVNFFVGRLFLEPLKIITWIT